MNKVIKEMTEKEVKTFESLYDSLKHSTDIFKFDFTYTKINPTANKTKITYKSKI